MKNHLTFLFISITVLAYGQKRKTHFPIWTFHQKNIIIDGVSVGLWNFSSENKNTTTNGIRLSLIGEGFLAPFLPESPMPKSDSSFQAFINEPKNADSSERINGINLSGTGTFNDYTVNGITLGFIGQMNGKVNGISAAGFLNFAAIHNGIQGTFFLNYCWKMNGVQCALIKNECYKMSGVQIGIFNKSNRTRGIQIGLWNVNEHRKFPLINWSFR